MPMTLRDAGTGATVAATAVYTARAGLQHQRTGDPLIPHHHLPAAPNQGCRTENDGNNIRDIITYEHSEVGAK